MEDGGVIVLLVCFENAGGCALDLSAVPTDWALILQVFRAMVCEQHEFHRFCDGPPGAAKSQKRGAWGSLEEQVIVRIGDTLMAENGEAEWRAFGGHSGFVSAYHHQNSQNHQGGESRARRLRYMYLFYPSASVQAINTGGAM